LHGMGSTLCAFRLVARLRGSRRRGVASYWCRTFIARTARPDVASVPSRDTRITAAASLTADPQQPTQWSTTLRTPPSIFVQFYAGNEGSVRDRELYPSYRRAH